MTKNELMTIFSDKPATSEQVTLDKVASTFSILKKCRIQEKNENCFDGYMFCWVSKKQCLVSKKKLVYNTIHAAKKNKLSSFFVF